MKTQITTQELANKLIGMTDERELKSYVFQYLSGNDNRFIRQEIIQQFK